MVFRQVNNKSKKVFHLRESQADNLPFVSIVVCTYNREDFLKKCLYSIFSMDYPRDRYEVIVIDGGSTDGTEKLSEEFPQIRFIVESKYGLAYARNMGAKLAVGSIVAYTDDDCVVDKRWLRHLVKGFQLSDSIIGVGGPVLPLHSKTVPKKILVNAALGLYNKGEKMKIVRGIITSNSAFKREIFKYFKFDETLKVTRRGKLILCGEDVDFCRRLTKQGYKLLYTPYAKVYHQLDRKRLNVWYIVRHAIHNGVSTSIYYFKVKKSRLWMIRLALHRVANSFLAIFSNRSFAACYEIIASLSTLLVCITGFDRIIRR